MAYPSEVSQRVWVDYTHLSDETDTCDEHSMVFLIEELSSSGNVHLHQIRYFVHNTGSTQGSLGTGEGTVV